MIKDKGRYKNTRTSERICTSKISKPIIGHFELIDGKEVFVEKKDNV
tara:strand:- start:7725 stop:7865 length:141 start_codon:yes stop_codon:yes gene_type:complete